jgi:hypothetical protein
VTGRFAPRALLTILVFVSDAVTISGGAFAVLFAQVGLPTVFVFCDHANASTGGTIAIGFTPFTMLTVFVRPSSARAVFDGAFPKQLAPLTVPAVVVGLCKTHPLAPIISTTNIGSRLIVPNRSRNDQASAPLRFMSRPNAAKSPARGQRWPKRWRCHDGALLTSKFTNTFAMGTSQNGVTPERVPYSASARLYKRALLLG